MSKPPSLAWRSAVVLLSLSLFATCLTQTAYITAGTIRTSGWDALPRGFDNLINNHLGIPLAFIAFVGVALFAVFAFTIFVVGGRIGKVAAVLAALLAVGYLYSEKFFGVTSWLANPILASAWWIYLLSGSRRPALIAAGISVLWMSSFLSLWRFAEGFVLPVTDFGAGFWLWLASAAAMVAGIGGEIIVTGKVCGAPCLRRALGSDQVS